MQNNRNTPEHRQWRREVLRRDGNACRECDEEHNNSHVHHIKPLEKYPDLATDIDNGITLCGNCHTRLKGKEESTNLQTIIEAVRRKPDMRTTDQLKRLNVKFCGYLEPLLKSEEQDTRLNAVFQLLQHLYVYPDSLNQFLPLIQCFLYRGKEFDRGIAGQIVIEFLKRNSNEAASQVHDAYAYVKRGETHMKERNYKNAIVDFTKALELRLGYADAYSGRGWARFHMQTGNYENALADFTKAIELNPYDIHAYSGRGKTHSTKGDYENAIADFTKFIELKPDYAAAYVERGEAYWRKGNYENAIADFTKAIELTPDYAYAYVKRGQTHMQKGNCENALADFTKAIELAPAYADAYSGRGAAYNLAGYYDLAQKDFEKAKELRKKQ